jgi:dienelactone hydrolase
MRGTARISNDQALGYLPMTHWSIRPWCHRSIGVLALLLALGGWCGASAASVEPVSFPSLSPDASAAPRLTAELHVPEGKGPHAAVVLLSGCYGIEDVHRQWARDLSAAGYAALVVDSFGPRGVKEVCTDPLKVGVLARAEDAYGAKRYLTSRPDIDGGRIAVAGWSHGGWTLLRVIHSKFHRIPDLIAAAGVFQAAIALYPYCDLAATPTVPLLVLIGDADDWTPRKLCDETLGKIAATPMLEYQIYAGATHSFDDPFGADENAIRSWITSEPPGTASLEPGGGFRYLGHLIKYDAAAHADAKARVLRFLGTHLRP